MSTKAIVPFDFKGNQVRAIADEQGQPWFVAKDVADALGYHNPAEAVRDHCKYPELLNPSKSLALFGAPRGLQIIPESDIYRLVMHSKLPGAQQFEEWVVGEVLPRIRKHGAYIAGQEGEDSSKALISKALIIAGAIIAADIRRRTR